MISSVRPSASWFLGHEALLSCCAGHPPASCRASHTHYAATRRPVRHWQDRPFVPTRSAQAVWRFFCQCLQALQPPAGKAPTGAGSQLRFCLGQRDLMQPGPPKRLQLPQLPGSRGSWDSSGLTPDWISHLRDIPGQLCHLPKSKFA